MPGPFLVRKAAALGTTEVTGDGKGSENPVPIAGANRAVLLLNVNPGATAQIIDIYMEITINGTDYYRESVESSVSASGVATVNKKTYEIPATEFATNVDNRIAVGANVLARFARFTLKAGGNTTSVAARALTGRV